MAIDDQLAALLAQNASLFATYEDWANSQVMLLAGKIDDPDSFNAQGGKTGALGYYPVVNVSGQTIYVPCMDRLRHAAIDGVSDALEAVSIVGEGLLRKTGSIGEELTLSVPAASVAETIAGMRTDLAVTPLGAKASADAVRADALAAAGAGISALANQTQASFSGVTGVITATWADPAAALHFDYAKSRYWQSSPNREFRSFGSVLDSGVTAIGRATCGSFEAGTALSVIAPDAIRRGATGAQIERASQNLLPNHDFDGAVTGIVGSGGAFPTGYEPNFAFVREVVATGTNADGRRYITYRLARSGNAPVATGANIRTLNSAKIAAPGPLVASGQLQVVSLSGVATGVQININEFQADGATSVGTTVGAVYTAASGLVTFATWRNVAAANRVTEAVNVVLSDGSADFEAVFTLISPNLEAGTDAEDYTSMMSNADGTNPRAADSVSVVMPAGTYDLLTRGTNYDFWSTVILPADGSLSLPVSKRDRKVVEHRAYATARFTAAQKQAVSDQRVPVLATVSTNQTVSGRTFFVQSAGQPWSLNRATNKNNYYRIECRKGFYWSGDTGQDRIRTEFQCSTKEAFNVDTWVAYKLRLTSPTGLLSDSLVLGQFHATEDAGDFAGYPVFELNLHQDGLYIYTASVAAASQPTAYDRVQRAGPIPVTFGAWIDVVIRIRFNFNGGAVLQVWVNGQLVVNVSGVSIGHNDAVGPYWKHGLYWRPQTVEQTVIAEYANFTIGTDSLLDRVANPPVAA